MVNEILKRIPADPENTTIGDFVLDGFSYTPGVNKGTVGAKGKGWSENTYFGCASTKYPYGMLFTVRKMLFESGIKIEGCSSEDDTTEYSVDLCERTSNYYPRNEEEWFEEISCYERSFVMTAEYKDKYFELKQQDICKAIFFLESLIDYGCKAKKISDDCSISELREYSEQIGRDCVEKMKATDKGKKQQRRMPRSPLWNVKKKYKKWLQRKIEEERLHGRITWHNGGRV